jgi:iron-sulfur cluster repair protein YtfE (RIC family)
MFAEVEEMIDQMNTQGKSEQTSRPIDMVRCLHNAFRRDSAQIDTVALSIARSGGDATALFERLKILGEILDYHAQGEEAAVFPAIDKLTPHVVRAYVIDHRQLDKMVSVLEEIRKKPDPLSTARATAILNSHLRIHLDKEDLHLYPILRERTTDDEQMTIGRAMSSKMPPQRFPKIINWLFPLLELNDQVTVTKSWKALMPPPVFSTAQRLIKQSIPQNWMALTKQIPELSEV